MITKRNPLPSWMWVGVSLALVFVGTSLWLMASVLAIRDGVESRVSNINILIAIETGLRTTPSVVAPQDEADLRALLESPHTDQVREALALLTAALDEDGTVASLQAAARGCQATVTLLRTELSTLSETLAQRWNMLFGMLGIACFVALLATLLGYTLHVKSEPGVGSTFSILLGAQDAGPGAVGPG